MFSRSKKVTLIIIPIIIIGVISVVFRLSSPELIKTQDGKFSIAILPFDNVGDSHNRLWVSDGMTEFISLRLQPHSQFLVVGANSVNQFKNTKNTFSEIADQLGVSYLIKGSILHQRNSLSIEVQLANKDEQIIWTQDYDVSIDELLNV